MKRRLACFVILAACLLACLCGCFEETPVGPSTEPPVTQPPVTQPPVTNPPVTNPPVTNPPITNPPVTEPPVTEPPVTEPPVTEPPVTQPPVTQPPVTQPPVTEPPVTEPPVTEPPVTQPPVTQPPVTQPPVTNPPVTEPPVCAHSYQTTTTAATCTAAGSTVSRCTKCGDTKTETIPALGHNSDKKETVNATCTEAGKVTTKCSRCGETVKTETIPVLGHNSDKKTVKDPTCTAKGTTTYSCSRCGKVMKTEEKAALGHAYGAWKVTTQPTTTKEGVRMATCSRCGTSKTEKIAKLSGLKALDPSEYYGYRYIGTLANGADMQGAYKTIVKASENCTTTIDVSEYHLTPDDIFTVYLCYMMDYPQHFWVGRELSYSSDGKLIYATYLSFDGGLDRARAAFESGIDSLLEGISGDDSEFVREEKAHDNLVDFCEYYTSGKEIEHNAYGAVVNGKAVCEGYARTMQYLMYRCGILCFPVNGKAQGGNHQWNIIRIDGEYYHLDVTFDDPVGANFCSHRFVNLTTKAISSNHTVLTETNYYPIPNCTATKYYYPTYAGTVLNKLTVDDLADAIAAYYEKHGEFDTIVLYYMGNPEDVAPFLKKELWNAVHKVQKKIDAFNAVKALSYVAPHDDSQFALFLKEF